ncbi:hypothetical protein LMG31884_34050 [Xanthomonas hydrangeae]|uniref:hypothetical protein n=1 Tax=Xanthomonas hydrangeae TaxID=2775159 RepID=UPI0019653D6C|nr:hypothetical protein LMG31884_34050 [Xanthomonas hydrangeae]CAD7722150.1 hypothetical protein LMG31884_34050 [Xanthomonas hydrangeae]CAD7738857.1 hypothetical protein LMG31887_33950 [Xanthomonas hydrangeae]CAD7738860.1 hypothetical protein LMG31887_33950 [Xanthomonas hydrangeae]
MLNLALILIAPAIGGALLYRLWLTRPARIAHIGLAVGQIPQRLRRRRAMAVRRVVTHG